MVVIDNVPTGLAIGTGSRVGRVMSGRILDGGFPVAKLYTQGPIKPHVVQTFPPEQFVQDFAPATDPACKRKNVLTL